MKESTIRTSFIYNIDIQLLMKSINKESKIGKKMSILPPHPHPAKVKALV
jgi:hypothetical protein